MCWQQRVGMVGEGSGGEAGTSSCLHTLPLPSLGNATSTHQFTKKSLDFVWLITYGHHCTHIPAHLSPTASPAGRGRRQKMRLETGSSLQRSLHEWQGTHVCFRCECIRSNFGSDSAKVRECGNGVGASRGPLGSATPGPGNWPDGRRGSGSARWTGPRRRRPRPGARRRPPRTARRARDSANRMLRRQRQGPPIPDMMRRRSKEELAYAQRAMHKSCIKTWVLRIKITYFFKINLKNFSFRVKNKIPVLGNAIPVFSMKLKWE